MRLVEIKTMEEVNSFLLAYIPKYNKQFTLPLNNINNAFEKQEELSKNNYILSVRAPRIISRDHSIQFEKKNYFSVNNDLQTLYFNHKTTACNEVFR